MNKRNFIIFISILVFSVILSACSNQSTNEIQQLEKTINNLSHENEKLKESNNELLTKLNTSVNKENELANEIKKLKTSNQTILDQIKEYEKNKKDSIVLKPNQMIVNKISASEYRIDATDLKRTDCNNYFFQHNDKVYVPFDFLEWFYDSDMSYWEGNYIKGLPYEKYIIKTDRMYSLNNLSGLIDSTDNIEIVVQDEYTKSYILDGLTIDYFEAGSSYTITKPTFMTERGITIGSTRSEVKKAYGTLGKDTDNIWLAFHTNEGGNLRFTFKDNTVIEISYRIH